MSQHKINLTVFLNGGADGMGLLVPAHEQRYFDLRPSTSIDERTIIPVNENFGMHPELAPLTGLLRAGKMGFVVAAGSLDRSRSHFTAKTALDTALYGQSGSGGWSNRYLTATESGNDSTLRAVTIDKALTQAMQGSYSAVALDGFDVTSIESNKYGTLLDGLVLDMSRGVEMFERPTDAMFMLFDEINNYGVNYVEHNVDALYPVTEFGARMKNAAKLIKSGAPVELLHVNCNGWDHHYNYKSRMMDRVSDLAQSIEAFVVDLGPQFSRVRMNILSEFGRRAYENGSVGIDHGAAGTMIVIGDDVKPGVHGLWPGLGADDLDRGDLAVTTDYRHVLMSSLNGASVAELSATFPGVTPPPFNCFVA